MLAYTVARLGLFVVVAGVFYLLGLRRFALVIVALVITLPLSYVLLRRQREALSGQIESRVQRRVQLRAQLRGDDDPQQSGTTGTDGYTDSGTDTASDVPPGDAKAP